MHVTICIITLLENIDILSYRDYSKYCHISLNGFQNMYLVIPLTSYLSVRKLASSLLQIFFQKGKKVSRLTTTINVICFLLSVKLTYFIFEKYLNSHTLSELLQVKIVFHINIDQLTTQTSALAFFLKTTLVLQRPAQVLYVCFAYFNSHYER